MIFTPTFEAPSLGQWLIIVIWGFIVFAIILSLLKIMFGRVSEKHRGRRHITTLFIVLLLIGIPFIFRMIDLAAIIAAKHSPATPAVEGEVKSFSSWGRSSVRFSIDGVGLTYGGSPDIRYQICGRREVAYVRVRYVPNTPYNDVVSIEMGCPKDK
jgi:hypothetical protein